MQDVRRARHAIGCAVIIGLSGLTAPTAQGVDTPPRFWEIAPPMMQMPLPVLVELVAGWVAADLGLPIPGDLPRVAFADAVTMDTLRRVAEAGPDGDAAHATHLVALYDSRGRTIFLPLGWTGQSSSEVAILVHEMVHHFQQLSGDRFACPAAREKLAYEVQERWLVAHGESLMATQGIDPMFLLVATNCLP